MHKKPLEEEYLFCIRCGLCLAVCPTYREYLTETASPRGRVALSRKGLEGELTLSPNLYEQMYSCFDCLACNEICPVGIRPADLALKMRYLQEQERPARWKNLLFGGVLGKPERMERLTLPLRLYQALGLRRLYYMLGLRRLLPGKLRDMEAMLPRAPFRPLRQIIEPVVEATSAEKRRVGFFLGCAQSLLFADESAAAVRVLARNGCTVATPPDVKCCGMPALGYGKPDIALDMARHNIASFEAVDIEAIITDCATCGSILKEYGDLLADDAEWSDRARLFSSKVKDISEYLAEIPLEKPSGSLNITATYHDPCHLRRGQGVWRQPRELLTMIDGLRFVELPEADWCCGSAGSQLITHYETSMKVLNRKMDGLDATAASVVAAGCPGCRMQLSVGIRQRNLPMQVVHPVTLLDQAYREERT